MTDAPLQAAYVHAPIRGIRRFAAVYYASGSAAADTLTCAIPTQLLSESIGGNIVVTNLEVLISATAAGIKFQQVYVAAPTSIPLKYAVSVNTVECIAWNNIDIACSPDLFTQYSKDYWIWITYKTGTLGDDYQIYVRGYIETPLLIEPVSLEGYKWPLVRR